MILARSRTDVPIRLLEDRWRHITARHPEKADQRERVGETLQSPDLVQEGDTGELLAIRVYVHTPLTSKHLVVAYREDDPTDGFVLTAYLTRRPSA